MEKNNKHESIVCFNPDVMSLEQSYQDFLSEIKLFDAGDGYQNFNDFIIEEAEEYKEAGDGVTNVVWNVICDKNGNEVKREVVAFYTFAATAIPYEDRIRLDEDEAQITGQQYDIQICGISALEIKMFAVSDKYQDVFYEYEGENLPIAAWVMRSIIDTASTMLNDTLGFKALFLHSLPNAEKFYMANGFNPMKINMQPLHCVDSEYKAMYLTLREVHMNYDE